MNGHNCDDLGCQIITEDSGSVYWAHICQGCHNDNPKRRWLVWPHPHWGMWHLDTCTPPHDWAGPGKEPSEPRYDMPVQADTGMPPEWALWTEEQRDEYVDARAFDAPQGYKPPVIPATPVTD
jgi:hypothetical protein